MYLSKNHRLQQSDGEGVEDVTTSPIKVEDESEEIGQVRRNRLSS